MIAAVIVVEPGGASRRSQTTALRTLLFDLLAAHNPAALHSLRPPGADLPPYTLAGPLVNANGAPFFRITTLTDAADDALCNGLLPLLPAAFTLDDQPYQVARIITDAHDHPDAGQASYARLIAQARDVPPPERYPARLVTPLAFHSQGQHLPLPVPALFWGSLFNRWQAYTGDSISAPLPAFIADHVAIGHYRLSTRVHSEPHPVPGAMGDVSFRVRRATRPDERLAWDDQARLLAVLAGFAFYAGVGIRTAQGMGQVRFMPV